MKKFKLKNIIKVFLVLLILIIIFLIINNFIVGEKKQLTNNYAGSLNYDKGLYLSTISDSFEKYLGEKQISYENINVDFLDIDYKSTNSGYDSFTFFDLANKNSLSKLKTNLQKQFGGDFEILNNITINDSDSQDFLFTEFSKDCLFDYSFDVSEDMDAWGINTSSDSILSNLISIDYLKDDNNYCLSLKDTSGDTLIFMKDMDFLNYSEAWDYYIDNKNDLNYFTVGEDSAIFKSFDISQIGLIPQLSDYSENNLNIQNYYIYTSFVLNGMGKNYLSSENTLDKNDIKYNFLDKTILFIVKDGENMPYFAYRY